MSKSLGEENIISLASISSKDPDEATGASNSLLVENAQLKDDIANMNKK